MRVKKTDFFIRRTFAAVLLLISLTAAIYTNSFKNSFAGDDFGIIVENSFIKSWENLPTIFSRGYLDSASEKEYLGKHNLSSGEKTYRPLVTLSYFIDYSIWRLNPFGYHLTNLLLHISNVVLLYFFIGLITRERKIALLTALFFGLHPVNSEAVNAIAFREDLLAFLFFVSSFMLFIKSDYYNSGKRVFAYIFSITLFVLALFSKEMAITLPVLLMLYDYYFVFQGKLKKIFARLKSRYLGYIAVSLFFLWVRFSAMVNIDETLIEYPGGNFYVNLLTMSKVFGTYLIWLIFPVEMHVTLRDSSFFAYSFFSKEVIFSISIIITCLALTITLHKKSKLISFAMLWFFIGLFPVSNIVPISTIMASRYLYIPAAGFCLLIAVLLCRLSTVKISFIPPPILKKAAQDTIVVLVIFYSTFTIIRNLTWKNNITLWTEAVEYYPNNAFAHRGLGDSFRKIGLLDEAIGEYKAAIDLDPYHVENYNFLGFCYAEKRQYRQAVDCLKEAIKIDPKFAQAYNNLGVVYARTKKLSQAKEAFEKVLEIEPEFEEARDNLKELGEIKSLP